MELIPAIDLINGQCVRLSQGRYNEQTTYPVTPADMARKFEDHGIKRLHLVDLDGARNGAISNWRILEEIAGCTQLIIDFSGGIQTDQDIQRVFDCGARIAAIGSIAVTNPMRVARWIETYGAPRILPGADVRNENLAIRGWTQQTTVSIFNFTTQMQEMGITTLFCTDVSKDGQLQGPSLELYKKITEHTPGIQLIASGGVRSVADLRLLQEAGCAGAIIGKALYEGYITLEELKNFS